MGQDLVCSCGQPAKYRCTECYGMQLFCRGCLVNGHRTRPLCRIEVRPAVSHFLFLYLHLQAWNGNFFEKRELRHLGLRV
jgi:hypothetical protein